MKVSVIVISYNIQDCIAQCLDSLNNQTYKEFEIIVVDDGSCDNTMNIIKEYKKLNKNIKLIQKDNGGPASARNVGLRNSNGEYILFIDGDDWIEPDTIEKMYSEAQKFNADIVISDFFVNNGNEQTIHKGNSTKAVKNIDVIRNLFLSNIIPSALNKLYKKSLFDDYNIYFDEELFSGEDLEINTRLFYFAQNIVTLEEPFLHYVKRPNSLSHQNNRNKLTIYKAISKIELFLKRTNLYDDTYDEFNILSFNHLFYLKIFGKFNLDIHKYIYNNGKKTYFKVKDTSYYRSHILKNMRFIDKINLYLFIKSYNLGNGLLKLRHRRIYKIK
ncbi:glycosyltransferase family 2 protein [Clostridium sporogenes]|uniref:glycosyltransferase family 2 protein n=1 Tax=Clostridium sporogenes TaxID=1509 RepID=UPI003F932E12